MSKENPNIKSSTPSTEVLIEQGKRGVTNTQMLEALKKHKDNDENWNTLFKQYPDIFISTAKYLPPELKKKAVTLIQTVFPDYKIMDKREDRIQSIIETVKKMIADKADKEKIVDVIISNRKNEIKQILMELL